jgi:hypothetical protein
MESILRKRRYTRKYHKKPTPLRSSYGIIKLPKGTRLYHVSSSEHCTLPSQEYKPILFLTLHPSEWYVENAYVSTIELQSDIDILFMVQSIRQMRIFSSLNIFLGKNGSNLAKMNTENIRQWVPLLQKENLNGWFSSIENKTGVEFAIMNDPRILNIVECKPLRYNWTNSSYNETLIPKNWGTTYPVSTIIKPVTIVLNSRFKEQIDAYIKYVYEEDRGGTAFSLLLENANIIYFDAPLEEIRWAV